MAMAGPPCAACKVQRRKCTQECVFAPYFPPDNPEKFINVHRVFGASNVSKLLSELEATRREDAVNSLAYEAEARLRDPVYGCVGLISYLQSNLKMVRAEIAVARSQLARFQNPEPVPPNYQYELYAPYLEQQRMLAQQRQQEEKDAELMRINLQQQQQQQQIQTQNFIAMGPGFNQGLTLMEEFGQEAAAVPDLSLGPFVPYEEPPMMLPPAPLVQQQYPVPEQYDVQNVVERRPGGDDQDKGDANGVNDLL